MSCSLMLAHLSSRTGKRTTLSLEGFGVEREPPGTLLSGFPPGPRVAIWRDEDAA